MEQCSIYEGWSINGVLLIIMERAPCGSSDTVQSPALIADAKLGCREGLVQGNVVDRYGSQIESDLRLSEHVRA